MRRHAEQTQAAFAPGYRATPLHSQAHAVIKELLLRIARLCGLFALARRLTRGQLRILCYHGIWIGSEPHYGDCLFMGAQRFARRMELLARRGYRVIPLDEGCRALRAGRVGARDVVITIDDAWVGTAMHMLPVLKAHGYPATLYVTTEDVVSQRPVLHVMLAYLLERATRPADPAALLGESEAPAMAAEQLRRRLHARLAALPDAEAVDAELARIGALLGVEVAPLRTSRAFMLMTGEELRRAAEDGVDIELHTHSHRMPDFDLARIRRELAANQEALDRILGGGGRRLRHFCYPGGAYHSTLFPLLQELGIESATTTEFGLNPPGANMLALGRILDCECLSEVELEARLSGFWSLASGVRSRLARVLGRQRRAAASAAR